MKRLILTGLVLVAFGQLPADAQNKKKVQDDIYYNADDAKKEAEQKAVEQQAYEAEMRRLQEEENANKTSSDYDLDYTGEDSEYIDYDDDDYSYANRFNRFNSPYYGGSYWAYDPFWYGGGGWGYGSGWGWGPSWGIGVGYGGPYWSSYWGWNTWCGYPGFYSAWGSPYYGYGWGGYGGWGYGGYYNGFYDGYYAGAYNSGFTGRSVNYGPRSSMNRYPGSTRASGTRSATTATRNQLRTGNGTGEMRQAPNSNGSRNYSERVPSAEAGGKAVERRAPSDNGNYSERSYPSENSRGLRNDQGAAPRQYNSGSRGTMQQAETAPQRNERSFQRSEPSYQRSEPAQQRPQPSYSAPSRSYSAPSSSPSRSSGGGSFGGGGSRSSGGRR